MNERPLAEERQWQSPLRESAPSEVRSSMDKNKYLLLCISSQFLVKREVEGSVESRSHGDDRPLKPGIG